ncbi:hypothetical protein V8F33_001012 [Rhypophila sp. PSN 637]
MGWLPEYKQISTRIRALCIALTPDFSTRQKHNPTDGKHKNNGSHGGDKAALSLAPPVSHCLARVLCCVLLRRVICHAHPSQSVEYCISCDCGSQSCEPNPPPPLLSAASHPHGRCGLDRHLATRTGGTQQGRKRKETKGRGPDWTGRPTDRPTERARKRESDRTLKGIIVYTCEEQCKGQTGRPGTRIHVPYLSIYWNTSTSN